jgi:prephenate dehydrogenase
MIGIVGFGRFGRLMASYLARDFDVGVWNRTDKSGDVRAVGARPCTLEEVSGQKIVVVSVPISRMEETLARVGPLLSPGALVVDVCSVKIHPVRWMEALLPQEVSILGTHPMFGPDSAAASLEGRKIVLCPVRLAERRLAAIRRYLKARGLAVIETTPEDHDRQIAVSLSLTHFIGRSLAEFGAEDLAIDTEGYRRLLYTLEVVTHDTWQLFEDMHRYNPFARDARTAFIEALGRIDARLSVEADTR